MPLIESLREGISHVFKRCSKEEECNCRSCSEEKGKLSRERETRAIAENRRLNAELKNMTTNNNGAGI